MNRHPTHPSELCECDTCDLEHQYKCHTSRVEFAVNPHTGTIVELYPTTTGWCVGLVNHTTKGATLYGWHEYKTYAAAFDTYWHNAEQDDKR